MGLPTGVFQSLYAGTLLLTLTAEFSSTRAYTPGFPSRGEGENEDIALQGYVGPSGSPIYTQPITKYALSSVAWIEYPGGNVSWPCGVIEQGFRGGSGILTWRMENVRLSFKLFKR